MKLSVIRYGQHFRLVVVGGGAAGMGASHKFARKLPKFSVAVIEPNEKHYYQPGFTMVGGGWMTVEQNTRREKDLIHPKSVWIQDQVVKFEPKKNLVKLKNGDEITYDYMVLATGVQLRWDMIKGLPEALETPGVTSNYSPLHCTKTYKELTTVTSGNCIFTFPNTPIKCAGAPQKVCYYGEDIVRSRGYRDKTHFIYATSLPRLFGIEAYLSSLNAIAKSKDIDVRTRHSLVGVDTKNKIAKFELLDENCVPNGKISEIPYSLLHIGPPCSTPPAVRECRELTDEKGWVDVDPQNSKNFANVFAAGDCMNTGNAKTAAAVSSHLKTLDKNLSAVLEGKEPSAQYDGYASCPIVVSRSKAILAEFRPDGQRMETTPFNQSVARRHPWYMKRYLMPFLYWRFLVKGRWNGPATIRKMLHLWGLLPKVK
uniref:Sulfide:quinone oxidoreductase, mitochondrial n=1 Tax=Haemonchus contortus TaxID=6289 RepID=A0A7I4YBC4_HAECO